LMTLHCDNPAKLRIRAASQNSIAQFRMVR
jgi:hypothetical protein